MQQQPLSLGDVIKQARETDGISIRELSRRSGVSAGQISRIESGETAQPAGETITSLATALGGSPAPLLKMAGHSGEAIDQEIEKIRASFNDAWDVTQDLSLDLEFLEDFGDSSDGPALFESSRLVRPEYWLGNMGLDGSADDIAEIFQAWPALTPERRKLVRAFVADQEVLSALDRLPSPHGRYEISIELEETAPEASS